MLRFAPALALVLAASAAQALEVPPLCQALHGLADEARASGQPQRISILTAGDKATACRRDTPGPASAAFCGAVLGMEPHTVPWRVNECVQTVMADPQLFTGSEPSGYKSKPRINRLAGKLGGGIRFDIGYQAEGRYDLVVWRVK